MKTSISRITSIVAGFILATVELAAQSATLSAGANTCAPEGGTVTFTATASYTATPTALGWSVQIPNGWSYVSGTNEPGVKPSAGRIQTLEWAYITVPADNASFTFTLSYPAGKTTQQEFTPQVILRTTEKLVLNPTPVILNETGEPAPIPVISNATINLGTYGTPYSFEIAATSSSAIINYSATNLPAGLGINNQTGVISGTPSAVGTFSIGLSATNIAGTGHKTLELLIQKASQSITFPAATTLGVGDKLTLNATASSGLAVTYALISGVGSITNGEFSSGTAGTATIRASQAGNPNYNATTKDIVISVQPTQTPTTPPVIKTNPSNQTSAVGTTTTLNLALAQESSATYQWQQNGRDIPNAAQPSLTLANIQPAQAGIYTVQAINNYGTTVSTPVVVGVLIQEKLVGTGTEVEANIIHPNKNVFDQVLMNGAAVAIHSDTAQITRTSYIDTDGDIVQVEFSGPGTLTLQLDNPAQPAPPENYSQNVKYVKGMARIIVVGATEQTNLSVFSVGKATAYDPTGRFDITKPCDALNSPTNNGNPIFGNSKELDAIADISFIAITSSNGKFGGLRAGNTYFQGSQGIVGVYAPGVTFQGPVNLGNITAFDLATPTLVLGHADTVQITGGDMEQANKREVLTAGVTNLRFVDGQDSNGNTIYTSGNHAQYVKMGR